MNRFLIFGANITLVLAAAIAYAATIEVYGLLYTVLGSVIVVAMQFAAVIIPTMGYIPSFNIEEEN